MKARQVLKIMNARKLMERREIENWLLTTAEEAGLIDGNYGYYTRGTILKIDEFNDRLWRNIHRISRSKIYRSYHCGHSYDCCGCLCSTEINAYKNGDFLTVIGSFGYNY